MPIINEGDLIFIVYDRRRQWLRKIHPNGEFHCDKGFLRYNDVIGKNIGQTFLLLPQNNKIALLPPLPSDIIFHMRRESQIIYPEDISLIIVYGKIISGCKILEAGCGSGTVTSIMAFYCAPTGFVYSFDIRDIALKQAQENVDLMGVKSLVSLKLGNVCEDNLSLEKIDFIMLDMATPWLAIPKVKRYLSPHGRICCFSPTFEQIKKDFKTLQSNGFKSIITMELLNRHFQVKPNATRPVGRMVGHTGYLVFATLDDSPLLSNDYNGIHSPENIGYLLIYGGIRPGINVLIIESEESMLSKLLSEYLPDKSKIYVIKTSKKSQENEIHESIIQFQQSYSKKLNENFDAIIIDNIESSNLIRYLLIIVKNGASFCVLSQYIEHAKNFYAQMSDQNFFEVDTCELIKRIFTINHEQSAPESVITPHSGYITIGRKVEDLIECPKKSVPNEKVEIVLDTATDLSESLPEEPEKIDYANLKEDEN